jgi:predicted O-methyltransferase YrrM
MKVYQNYVNALKIHSNAGDESRFVAIQLLEMHYEALKRLNPAILELGVDKGQSTKIFLNAIHGKKNAYLVSVDISDCSSCAESKNWRFIQQDSADIDQLIKNNPKLKKGIDILYVDSKHTAEHVKKEVYGLYKYVKKNGVIFFDDIDSGPYMMSQRKDSVSFEIANRQIFILLESIFRANYNSLDLYVCRGSTGLAKFVKRDVLGSDLNPPLQITERRNKYFWKLIEFLTLKKTYKHDDTINNNFLNP